MIIEWNLILFNIVCVFAKIQTLVKDLDYSPEYFLSSSEHKYNLRRKFLDKRRQNIITAKRVEMIDKYLSDKSVFVDGITHEKLDEKHKQWKLVNKIEKAFKDLIEMNGVKYYFKRDPYWRTWRKAKYSDGDRMVCYRCESSLNCNDCQYAGYWVIDESPPCPYEIISVNNNTDVCAINFNNSTNTEERCPSVVSFADIMRTCDNPIHTQWKVQKSYKKEVSERYPAIICGGRDYCRISTFYTITRDYVSFRIVNSTNHIFYSKVMKNNNTNYACASDCGYIDPDTNAVSKTSKPLIVDLINGKKKRDDKTKSSTNFEGTRTTGYNVDTTVFNSAKGDSTVFDKTTPRIDERVHKLKMAQLKHAINEMETIFNLPTRTRKNVVDDDNYNNPDHGNKYHDYNNHDHDDRHDPDHGDDHHDHNNPDHDDPHDLNHGDDHHDHNNPDHGDHHDHNNPDHDDPDHGDDHHDHNPDHDDPHDPGHGDDHHDHNHPDHDKKHPTCSSMKHRMEEEMSDEINTFY